VSAPNLLEEQFAVDNAKEGSSNLRGATRKEEEPPVLVGPRILQLC